MGKRVQEWWQWGLLAVTLLFFAYVEAEDGRKPTALLKGLFIAVVYWPIQVLRNDAFCSSTGL